MRERILILVKTYPMPSKSHIETVCTAGIREDGSWVRIYPVPFRILNEKNKYRKYQWIECELSKRDAAKDCRPESMHLDDPEISLGERVGAGDHWLARRKAILEKARIYTNKRQLLADSGSMKASLALFRPSRITKFEVTPANPDWEPKTEAEARNLLSQNSLFESNDWREYFHFARKIPYTFHYTFTDDEGAESRLQITDWEIGALYLDYVKSGKETIAAEKIRHQYYDRYKSEDREIYFYLGTSYKNHMKNSPNPWMIVGVAPFPKITQMELPGL